MLKQSPSRNQRSKGFKVKHALQICLLLAICIWLLYQVKQTYDKKAAFEKNSKKIATDAWNDHGILKLGRKGLDPQLEEIAAEFKKHEDEEDELEEDKLRENEGERRGGGDDEIYGRDHEKAEEEEPEQLEDLIDEDDNDKEETNEGKESVEMDNYTEDVILFNNQHSNGVQRNSEEAKEEYYKGDTATKGGNVIHNTQLITTEKENGILRAVKEEEQVTNAAKNEVNVENKSSKTEEVDQMWMWDRMGSQQ